MADSGCFKVGRYRLPHVQGGTIAEKARRKDKIGGGKTPHQEEIKVKKKGLAVILCICMILALLPVTARAKWGAEVYIGNIHLSLNDEDEKAYAVVDSAGTVTTDGANESNYHVKFEAVMDPDTYESVATLTLKDFNYAGSGNYRFYEEYSSIYAKQDINIVLIGSNTVTNLISETAYYSYGILCNGRLAIKGNGSLTATGGQAQQSRGIYAYGLSIEGGMITAKGGNSCDGCDSFSCGIGSGRDITIQAGTVKATGGTSDDLSAGIYAGESFTVNNGTVEATSGTTDNRSYGILCDGTISYQNGVMIARSGEDAWETMAINSAPVLPNKYVWRTSENTDYSQLWSNGYSTIGTAYSYNEEQPGTYLELRRVAVYPASFEFGSTVEGYNAPDPQIFSVYNCSDNDVVVNMQPLSDQNDPSSGGNEYISGYNFGAILPWTISGRIGTSNVWPKTGLAAGTYNETITVSDSNGIISSTTVTFTVSAAPPVFVPVTDITMTNAASVQVNIDLTLWGTVSPANATNKDIVWSLENAGTTGATVVNGLFKATAAGTATIKATVINGATEATDYSETFEITVTEVPDYKIIKGANGKWTSSGNSGLAFTANGEFPLFSGVKVDGTLLSSSDYTAVSGSTVVTLKPSYLSTLSVGTHNLSVLFNDGEAVTQFVVQATVDVPETSDSSNILLWLILMFVCGSGLLYSMLHTIKKRKQAI